MYVSIIHNGVARTARDKNNKIIKRGDRILVNMDVMDRQHRDKYGKPNIIKKNVVAHMRSIDSDNTITFGDFEDPNAFQDFAETAADHVTKVGG